MVRTKTSERDLRGGGGIIVWFLLFGLYPSN